MGKRETEAWQCSKSWNGFTLSIWMTKSKNWKDQWLQPCPASGTSSIQASWKRMQSRNMAMRRSAKQCMVVWWNPTILRDREQTLCSPKQMKIALLEKHSLPWHIIIWCISLSRCHKQWRFRMQRLPWTRNGKSSRQFQHGIWEKPRAKRGHPGRTKRQNESPLCHIDGHTPSQKNAELEPKLQKYKGRVVLRGDIVKDDSGAYAVFTEQG